MVNLESILRKLVNGQQREAKKEMDILDGDFYPYLRPKSVVYLKTGHLFILTKYIPPTYDTSSEDYAGWEGYFLYSDGSPALKKTIYAKEIEDIILE